MAGNVPEASHVLLWDDDHYYLGGVIAERLADAGIAVTLITTAPLVSAWTVHTLEQERIQRRLIERGVRLLTGRKPLTIGPGCRHACVYSGAEEEVDCDAVVLVTGRRPRDGLYKALVAREADAPWSTLTQIGDAQAPGTVAAAVYAGHNQARLHDAPASDGPPFDRELAG